MNILKERCIACEICHPYCPVGAIRTIEWEGSSISQIDQDGCVECGVCLRSGVCPSDAFEMPELTWPRTLRAEFSNPLTPHHSTKEGGRGTEEMKTNDVTGRFGRGATGISIEVGRPSLGARFRELEKVAMAIAGLNIEFEPQNPVTALMMDRRTGKIHEDVLNEKVLSAIIEFKIENSRLKEALDVLKALSAQVGTVFSVGLISPVERDGSLSLVAMARACGFHVRPNGKVNVGLGRPLKQVV
jgi:NAD-dependent dihydropyrimidine dehydrogenase PreA subunit